MDIVGDIPNSVGSITVPTGTRFGYVPFKDYKSPLAYPTTDGERPVSNALVESYRNLLFPYRIEKVIFHDPATIVIWADKTKTVVKRHNEPYDREKGLAMCIAKKVLGEKFHSTFREWCGGDV